MTMETLARIAAAALAAACLAMAGGAQAQAPDTKTIAADQPGAPATLNDLKGLFGEWAGPTGAASFSSPMAGQVTGYLLLARPDGAMLVHEYWVLRPDGASVTLYQKHYTPDMKDREAFNTFGVRRLAAPIDAGHIYLDNLTWFTKGDTLDLAVTIPGQNGAPPRYLAFSFKRVKR
jgi:hypothetical protein